MEYIAHHGIKGQEWGKRNGPPYPLDKKVAKQIKSDVKKSNRKRHGVLMRVNDDMMDNSHVKNAYDNNKERLKSLSDQYKKDLSDFRNTFKELSSELFDDFNKNPEKYLTKDYKQWAEDNYYDPDYDSSKKSIYTKRSVFEDYYVREHPRYKDGILKVNESRRQFQNETKRITNELLGEYGDTKVHLSFQNLDYNVERIVSMALQDLSLRDGEIKVLSRGN